MKKRNLQNLFKIFCDNSNGITLIKIMALIYSLRKSNVDYPLFDQRHIDEYENSVQEYINKLIYIYNSNNINYRYLDRELGQVIVKDSDDLISALFIINEMTNSEIEEFLKDDSIYNNDRDNYGSTKELSDLVIKLLYKNDEQMWMDLGCGQGNFLVRLCETTKHRFCIGNEIDYDNKYISDLRLNLINDKHIISHIDTLNIRYNEKVDVAYAYMPFVMRLQKNIEFFNGNNQYISDMKSSQNADWMFADRLLQSTFDRGIIVMTDASLMNIQDYVQRKEIVDQNFVEGIIKLPSNLFSYTGISINLVILSHNKKDTNIKFLDATSMCDEGRRISLINPNEIFEAYNNENICKTISYEEVVSSKYNLKVTNYTRNIEKVLQNEKTLQELTVEIFRGVQIPASVIDENSKISETEKTYKLLSVSDIQDGTVEKEKLHTIADNGKYERYLLKSNDVLISTKSTKIKIGRVKVNEDEKIIATGSILVIRCNTNKLNPIYLKTFLDSQYGAKLLESIQTGTTIISINVSALLSMKIPYVNMAKQLEIAKQYTMKLIQFQRTKERLKQLEKELNNIFEENI